MAEMTLELLEWLTSSIDATRPHTVTQTQAWHGRLMILAWGVLIPLGIFTARYLKVTPGQNWPDELDNKFWWNTHLSMQIGGSIIALIALCIILGTNRSSGAHGLLGWTVVCFACAQLASGFLRGSRGGPTDTSATGSLDGDHYNMTWRRRAFEVFHKVVGYVLLALGAFGVVHGMWTANAPYWMFLSILSYWLLLSCAAMYWTKRFSVIPTYHAIWGLDPKLPGNRKP